MREGIGWKVDGPMQWLGTAYRPVALVARDSHEIGESIGSAALSGNYAVTALDFNATLAAADAKISNLRISHASTAIAINGRTGHELKHLQIVNCTTGIATTSATFYLGNALFSGVTTGFNCTGSTATAEHVTASTRRDHRGRYLSLGWSNGRIEAGPGPIGRWV